MLHRIGLGKLKLSPSDFDQITAEELLNAWEGKREEEEDLSKENWRVASWIVSFTTQFTDKSGKYKQAKEYLPHVWGEEVEQKEQKSKEELEAEQMRIKKFLKVK